MRHRNIPIRSNPFLSMCGAKKLYEVALEVIAKTVDILLRIFADELHLSHM